MFKECRPEIKTVIQSYRSDAWQMLYNNVKYLQDSFIAVRFSLNVLKLKGPVGNSYKPFCKF